MPLSINVISMQYQHHTTSVSVATAVRRSDRYSIRSIIVATPAVPFRVIVADIDIATPDTIAIDDLAVHLDAINTSLW